MRCCLFQTQQLDSSGAGTIAHSYTEWYTNILLRRVSAGHICFSPTLKSFVSLTAEGAIPFNAEEFTDPSELQALSELLGERVLLKFCMVINTMKAKQQYDETVLLSLSRSASFFINRWRL